MSSLHHGMNLFALHRHFLAIGGTIKPVRRTGEIRYSHPLMLQRPRADGRRKDAPRHLVAFVIEVERRIRWAGFDAKLPYNES